jgi:hypothetical protein
VDKNDLVTVSGLVLTGETEWAICVIVDGDHSPHWMPESQIDRRGGLKEKGDTGELDIPCWLAEDRGLEYEE